MPIIVGNTTTNSAITSTSLSEMAPQSFVVTNALRNSVRPALLLPFAQSGTVDPRITFTRASSATYFNSQGVLTTAPNNVPRIDFDPATGRCLGLLIEGGRTNSIRNNTMVGAVAGTPGTLPTNWASINGSTDSGVTLSVIGVGQENGISYIDVGISGTATATSSQLNIALETNSGIAASSGQVWSFSGFSKIVTGSLNNIGIYFQFGELNSSGGYLQGGLLQLQPTTSSLAIQRSSASYTIANASTAFIRPLIYFAITNGQTYNFTLRIGLPQLELGAFATSVIATTTAAATRTIENARIPLGSWYNASAFSLLVEAQKNTTADTGFATSVELNDGTGNRRISFYNSPSTANLRIDVSTIVDIPAGTYTSGVPYKIAAAVTGTSTTTGTIVSFFNGAAAGSGITTNLNSASYTNMNIGYIGVIGAGNQMNGWIQRIAYYPVAFSNTQLQAMSS